MSQSDLELELEPHFHVTNTSPPSAQVNFRVYRFLQLALAGPKA